MSKSTTITSVLDTPKIDKNDLYNLRVHGMFGESYTINLVFNSNIEIQINLKDKKAYFWIIKNSDPVYTFEYLKEWFNNYLFLNYNIFIENDKVYISYQDWADLLLNPQFIYDINKLHMLEVPMIELKKLLKNKKAKSRKQK